MEIQRSSFSGGSSARVNMEDTEQALTCPICEDVFTNPVRLPCGHNFCQACICIVWNVDDDDSEARSRFCPKCQIFLPLDLKFETNADLRQKVEQTSTFEHEHVSNVTELTSSSVIMCDQCIERSSVAVKSCLNCDASLCSAHTIHHQHRELLRRHTLIELTNDLLSYKCQEHGEEQNLFCQDDQAAVCSLCVVFGAHRSHGVMRLHEACSDFKSLQKALEERDAELLENRHQAECALHDLQRLASETTSSAKSYRVKIAETYRQIKALIVKDQQLMMDIVEMEEIYTNKWLLSKRESLEQEIKDINSLLSESKSLLQENDRLKLLKHLKGHTFSRTRYKSTALPSLDTHMYRMETVEDLAESFYKAVFKITSRLWANLRAIHFDADTAHPNLAVSSDLLEVCWSKQNSQKSKHMEHVSAEYSILAKESFLSGTHYWEIAVWEKPYWLIGLSYESNTQTEEENATPDCEILNKAFCYIYHGNGRYLVCNGADETMLAVTKTIRKVGVCVEIEKGRVSIYDADTVKLLNRFAIEILGAVRPFFNPCLCSNKQNAQPLILINRKEQKEV